MFDISENAFERSTGQRGPRRNNAVAAVLGGAMAERIRRERVGDDHHNRRRTGMPKDELDIELLLKGAEKLCHV